MSDTLKLFESFKSNLKEEISDEAYDIADKIAEEIYEKGIMNFMDIRDRIVELSGKDLDEESDFENDIHVILNYKGISTNFSTGDFYTDEYAKEHPDVLEEAEEDTATNPYTNFEEVNKMINAEGGLYGFVAEKYYSMPIELLKEIALNALYELNNDAQVLEDVKERLYNEEV